MKALILAGALTIALAACSLRPSGVVVGRDYDAPEVSSKRSCSTSSAGKSKKTSCKTKPVVKSAEWELTVRQDGQDREVDVTRAEFDSCPEGSTYPECIGGAQ